MYVVEKYFSIILCLLYFSEEDFHLYMTPTQTNDGDNEQMTVSNNDDETNLLLVLSPSQNSSGYQEEARGTFATMTDSVDESDNQPKSFLCNYNYFTLTHRKCKCNLQ